METKHTKETLADISKTGLAAIFTISPKLWSIPTVILSFLISIAFFTGAMLFEIEPYALIKEIKDQAISFLPDVLGFTIGGFAFLIGFNGAYFNQRITEPLSDSKYSLYQEASASFAVNLFFQAITLIFAYVIHFVMYMDPKGIISAGMNTCLVKTINVCCLYFLILLLILSLFMIVQIILNVFAFSQLYHYLINKEKVDKKKKSGQEPY